MNIKKYGVAALAALIALTSASCGNKKDKVTESQPYIPEIDYQYEQFLSQEELIIQKEEQEAREWIEKYGTLRNNYFSKTIYDELKNVVISMENCIGNGNPYVGDVEKANIFEKVCLIVEYSKDYINGYEKQDEEICKNAMNNLDSVVLTLEEIIKIGGNDNQSVRDIIKYTEDMANGDPSFIEEPAVFINYTLPYIKTIPGIFNTNVKVNSDELKLTK